MTVFQARRLRRALSPPEAALWNLLLKRPSGFKFRRQHPFGPYVFDYYCHQSLLAVEIDGLGHQLGDKPLRDERRDEWVARHGVATLRVDANDVRNDVEAVLVHFLERCTRRTPPPPAAVPLPSNSRGG